MVTDYSPELDFWEANPQMTVFGPFSKLYNKGKAKKKTSQIAWGVFLYSETSDRSLFSRYPDDEKKQAVNEEFGVDFENELHLECIEFYKNNVLTPIEKLLLSYEDFLKNRIAFITNQEYGFDTMDALDKAAAQSKKIWDDYLKVKEQFDKEKKQKGYGGFEMSMQEKGII